MSRLAVRGRATLGGTVLTSAPPAEHPWIMRNSETYPSLPLLDAFGRPEQPWQPTLERQRWGRIEVRVGGKDVSFFRGVPTRVGGWRSSEPFGDVSALLVFPQISPMEYLGVGALSWAQPLAQVDLVLRRPDGSGKTLFEGWLGSEEAESGEDSMSRSLHCIGALFIADLRVKEPEFLDLEHDLGERLRHAINHRIFDMGLPLQPMHAVTTGISTRPHGAWQPLLTGWAQDYLATAHTGSGDQWTLALERPRRPKLVLKDRDTEHWTVTCGGRGVSLNLARDHTMTPTVIYGSGTDPQQCQWRNSRFPNIHIDVPDFPLSTGSYFDHGDSQTGFQPFSDELRNNGYAITSLDTYLTNSTDIAEIIRFRQSAGLGYGTEVTEAVWNAAFASAPGEGSTDGAYFAPLAELSEVDPYLYNAQGGIIGDNPDFDPHVPRIERFENFGDRVTKAEGILSARREIEQYDAGWTGTVTLRSDPEEGSRFEILAGQNLHLMNFADGDWLLHIADVDVSDPGESGAVTLTVDERARDLMTLSAIRARNRDTKDPAGRQRPTHRNSKQVEDRIAVFDCESGAGVIPKISVPSAGWVVRRFIVGQLGTMVRTEMSTSPARRFSAGLFDRPITAAQLEALIPTPLELKGDPAYNPWDDVPESTGLVIAWGGPNEAAGFYPKPQWTEDTENPLTGQLIDDASWYYESTQSPWMWLAVWADGSTTLSGRLYQAP